MQPSSLHTTKSLPRHNAGMTLWYCFQKIALLAIFLPVSMPLCASEPCSNALAEQIKNYGSTRPAILPAPDESDWRAIDCNLSAAPGRMNLPRNIVVDKPNTRLHVVNAFGDTLCTHRICASRLMGQKHHADDWRTPEGTFTIIGLYNSTDWTYKDTGDKCYGPFFISLYTPPFWGIGIHGTNNPASVPGRRSHGCMRMHNSSIRLVKQLVAKDSKVIILPDRD